MAKERTSVRMQAQIRRMAEQGYSKRAISRILRIARKTIEKYLETDSGERSPRAVWIGRVNWDYVRKCTGKGTTIKQIHAEVVPEVSYIAFWRAFREEVPQQVSASEITIRLHHKPGEKTQIDFCDGLPITDPLTGKTTPTQLFCGVLPYRSASVVTQNRPLRVTSKPANGRSERDIDRCAEPSRLARHEQCLERRKTTAG